MENGKNKLDKELTHLNISDNSGIAEDDMEVTEQDYELQEEQNKLEAERLKEKYGIESEAGKTDKKAKKNKKGSKQEQPKSKSAQTLEDVEAVRSFYELISLKQLIKKLGAILGVVVIAVSLFNIGGYLQYIYVSEGGLVVEVAKHDHEYTKFGRRVDGDCQHLGYTVYICDYQYCEAEWVKEDELYGNHKYREAPVITDYRSESGKEYKKCEYECSICKSKNVVYIPLEEADSIPGAASDSDTQGDSKDNK